MNLSKKAKNIQPSVTLAISAKANEMKSKGIDVIGFGVGEPDFNTPLNIQEAAINAIRDGRTKYTAASGIPELKKAVAAKFLKENDLYYTESQIIISTGAKQCLANLFQAVLNPGDEVLIQTPYWVSYPELIQLADGVPVFIGTDEKDNFKLSIDKLEEAVTGKTKMILVNSPNNPTGTVYNKAELTMLADFAKKHNLIILADEIYEKLIYGNEEHISIASLSEDAYKRTVVINGVSKSFAMTGWRIGYAAGSEEIIKLMSNIQSHTTSNPCSIAQYASLEALTGPTEAQTAMIEEFRKRRNYMTERINSINGISCCEPMGAFYVMINISKLFGNKVEGVLINNSMTFSSSLLEHAMVAVVPGIAFGVDNYVRISYATSMENIINGLDRIEAYIKKYYNEFQ
ncbi:MAG: aspartate aminotransferase [Firmicutes bacterium]|nr:aspartate aminotransferase [Bacillota bacterium]